MRLPTTVSSRPCGLIRVRSSGENVYLPLHRAEVHADIVDVSVIVTITQQFWQYSSDGLKRAKYIFPVPARAAVCGFKLIAADGTVITAVAKEKEQARHEHEHAIAQGYTTGLVEHVTDDVFSISLGAIPGQQMITTETTYVLDLMDEDVVDQVRFQIPMYVGARYGQEPEGMRNTLQAPPERISISVDVRMHGTVRSIKSPTHPALVLSDGEATHMPHRVQHGSPDFLMQDFVLSIVADGLDAPRCFAQRAANGATAMQLNIVPRFNLPAVPRQEYIFVVDRSGSMAGSRIGTAKKTLVMLLRALPSEGTQLNIFSFGDRCDSLWRRSVPYDERALRTATEHVDKMDADYGGTEILSALKQVFKARTTTTPTACFVLTDGEAHDTDRVIEVVKRYVTKAKSNAPLRVFALGIGGMTSTAMCEGIARAGNGVCLMSTTSEGIIGKCSKLVRASRTYILKNVSVDWGVRTNLAQAYFAASNDLKGVRQAPAQVAAIYPGNRFIIFALIEDAKFVVPKEVVIRAQRDGHGEFLQFTVPVQAVEFPPEHPHPQLIPTLAARRAIMDLEDGNRTYCPPEVQLIITRLGTEYQLASKFTSFVAVDRRTDKYAHERLVPEKSSQRRSLESLADSEELYPPRYEVDSHVARGRSMYGTDSIPICLAEESDEHMESPRIATNARARRHGSPTIIVLGHAPADAPCMPAPPPPASVPVVVPPGSPVHPSPVSAVIPLDPPVSPPPPTIVYRGHSRQASKQSSLSLGSSLRSAFSGLMLRKSSTSSKAATLQNDKQQESQPGHRRGSLPTVRGLPSATALDAGELRAAPDFRRSRSRSRSPSPAILAYRSRSRSPSRSRSLSRSPRSRFHSLSRSRSRSSRPFRGSPSRRSRSRSPPPPRSPSLASLDARIHPRSRASSPHQPSRVTGHTTQVELYTPGRLVHSTSRNETAPQSTLSTEDRVLALIRLQSFDGSFSIGSQLQGIIGNDLLSEARRSNVDQKVWATLLAIAFLRKYMQDQPELLDGLVEKALEFVSRRVGSDVQALLARAQDLVG